MATKTTNLNLEKPDLTDNADISVINANMDLVDTAVGGKLNGPVVSLKEVKIDTTVGKTVATYNPSVNGNFEIKLYLRVITSNTNVSIAVNYTDAAGSQTKYMVSNHDGLYFEMASGMQIYKVGSYVLFPLLINAVASHNITITVTADKANQCYVSGTILGV